MATAIEAERDVLSIVGMAVNAPEYLDFLLKLVSLLYEFLAKASTGIAVQVTTKLFDLFFGGVPEPELEVKT